MNIEDKIEWSGWMLLVAVLALVASVIIPFAQKKYEEYRARRNFQYYLKKQIGLILNILTSEKLEYHEPSVKNEPKKEYLFINDFIETLQKDFKEHKNTVQPRVIFMLLMNVQKLCHFAYQLRRIISTIDLQGITDKTLEHGKELSKHELNKIYGLILICESFMGISLFHDKFDSIKSISRDVENDIWKGLKVEKDLLTNQNRLNEDLLILNDNENSLKELSDILLIINQETKKYFDYDILLKKRKKGSS
ncbi:hypothetical protein [Pontibacter burrus]|uniref:Uncharacterized protein n=1 Tax=Pontibacter burrus TaxID=2704466 RepID=A0A6B3LJN8_9BACT|nr:hypothetical protein [Pontibacter burrus]NEM96919.1 hypothetical protein [Pontibacter burrus]